MTKTKKSFGQKFIESQDRFFNSNIAFITFGIFSIFFALLQLTLFLTGVIPVVGTNDINAWGPWVYMVISPLGSALSLIGMVFTIRIDKKFFYPTLIGQSVTLVSSFLSGMVFTGFVMFVVIYSSAYRFVKIHLQGSNYKIWKYFMPTTIIINFVVTAVFIIIAATSAGDTFWFIHPESTPTDKIWYRELDVFSCFIAMFGQILLYMRNKNAFYWFLACNILFIMLFAVSSAWMSALYITVNVVTNISAVAAWTYRSRHPEEFK